MAITYFNNPDLDNFQGSLVQLSVFETAEHFLNTKLSNQFKLVGGEGKAV